MNIVCANIILLLIFALAYKCRVLNKKGFCIAASLILFLTLALRDAPNVGIDMGRYMLHYEAAGQMSLKDAFFYDGGASGLYYLFNAVAYKLGLSFQLYTALLCGVCVAVYGYVVYKASVDPLLSVAFFMGFGNYLFLFSGMRQSLSMTFALLCIYNRNKKKWKWCAIWLVAAVLTHTTAIVVVPYLFLVELPLTTGPILLYFMVMGLAIVFRVQLGRIITMVTYRDYVGAYAAKGAIGGTMAVITFLFMWYIYINWDSLEKRAPAETTYAWAYGIAVILQICASYSYAFTRVNLYYMQALSIALPVAFEGRKLKGKLGKYYWLLTNVLYLLVLAGCLYMFAVTGEAEQGGLQDYLFFWESR